MRKTLFIEIKGGLSLNKIRRDTFLFIVFLVIIFMIGIISFSSRVVRRNQPCEMKFVPAYGDVNCLIQKEDSIDLSFLVKNDRSGDFQKFISRYSTLNDVQFDTEEISVSDVAISKSMSRGDDSLYTLDVRFQIDSIPESGSYPVHQIAMDRKTFDLGRINFIPYQDLNQFSDLSLKSSNVFSVCNGPAEFAGDVTNKTNSGLKITGVTEHSFPDVGVKWGYNDGQWYSGMPFSIESGKQVSIEMTPPYEEYPDYSIFYLSPVIHYQSESGDFSLAMRVYTTGVPMDKAGLAELCKKVDLDE